MDPVSMMAVAGVMGAVGTVASAGLQAAGAAKQQDAANVAASATEQGAKAQADAINAQAAADQNRAIYNQQLAEKQALEERAGAQRAATEQLRSAKLAQSRLGAVAGSSGSSASDPTVMKVWESIEKEGQKNASMETAAGEQKAAGVSYQSALDRWSADTNASIKRKSANDTIIGGYMTADAQRRSGSAAALSGYAGVAGSLSSMALKYGGGSSSAGGSTGYSS